MAHVRPWHAALLAGGAACATAGFLACVDTTPFTLQETADAAPPVVDATFDSKVEEASHDAVMDAAIETGPTKCQQCLETPDMDAHGCGNEVAACLQNPKCARAIECAVANDCFDRGSSAGLIMCGYPCAQDAGITLTDPAINLAYAVFTCASTNCSGACRLGD